MCGYLLISKADFYFRK